MAQTGNHKGLQFGIFLAPFHRVGENPTLGMARDMELIEWIDELGYDEAWIGEHHSAGWETIASPELFIAAAVERTRYIRLGSGVTSLPYHHPLMVANRFVQLDHMSRGRTMLGCGPGALPRWVPVTESASKATVWLVSADRRSFTVGHDLNPATDRTFRFEMRRA